MDLIWIMIIFMAIVMFVFLVTALMLPEWVGITGKKAKEIMEHQQEKPSEAKPGSDSSDPAP